MKKILTIMTIFLMAFSILPMVFAEEADIGGGVVIDVGGECEIPEIYIDHTARGWYPNDQTINTADIYGTLQAGGKYGLISPDYDRYAVAPRQNYVFTGETLQYYLVVVDEDGEDDIDEVQLTVGGIPVGSCQDVGDAFAWDEPALKGEEGLFLVEHPLGYDGTIMNSYVCTLIAQSSWDSELEVSTQVTDDADNDCTAGPVTVMSTESDLVNFNPTLSLSLTGGSIDFGTVSEGSVAVSNTVYLGNDAEDGSGVVMDMYIASDDYFTDPTDPTAICGVGNGIRYDQFAYYATKGSLNSGTNNNAFPGLGDTICAANPDEFTTLPSHSGDIEDMCRIINWQQGSSLLTQGSEMSITFELDVPTPCDGSFTDGQFQFVGRIV